jgi:hypothetical protein
VLGFVVGPTYRRRVTLKLSIRIEARIDKSEIEIRQSKH